MTVHMVPSDPADWKATPPLDAFRTLYEYDDNIWWAVGCGHHMNLFDAACEEIDRLKGLVNDMGAQR